MKTKGTFQEILFFTNTLFSTREWLMKDESKEKTLSPKEKLEEACWNGLIPEILPEISEVAYDKKLVLWQVNAANNFLDLRFSYEPESADKYSTINPYIFLDGLCEN